MVRLTSTSAIAMALSLAAPAAFADVTASEVWARWKDTYVGHGYTVTTGAEDLSGDVLTLTDLTIVSEEDDTNTEITVPQLVLTGNDDGTVRVTMSEEITGQVDSDMSTAGSEPEPVSVAISLTQSDAEMIVSGTPEEMQHDWTVPRMTLDLRASEAEGEAAMPFQMTIEQDNGSGSFLFSAGDMLSVTSDLAAERLTIASTGADPETGETFSLSGGIDGLKVNSVSRLPHDEEATSDLAQALSAGGALNLDLTYEAANYRVEGTSEDNAGQMDAQSSDGSLAIAMDKDRMSIESRGGEATIAMSGTELPLPMSIMLASSESLIDMPLSNVGESQPFGVKLALRGVELSEQIWAMFDPQEQLPRDPATVVADLSGRLTPTLELLSAESAASAMPPLRPDALTINELTVQAAGADLRGQGDLTFAEDGPPVPVGQIALQLSGANALMDNLVAMGVVPSDQVMFARMMLGLYARPTGEDALETEIEFGEDGSISANGQRLQ